MAKSRSVGRTFFVGIGGLAFIGLMVLFGVTATSGLPGAPTTVVKAAFKNVGASLKVGDDVRENGSRIGRIAALNYDGAHGRAVATMEIEGSEVPVYADAKAALTDTSALAKKFIELDRGHKSAGVLGGRVIPESRNVDSADLDRVLNVLDPRTREALTSTIREVGQGSAGHSQDLHDLLEHAPPILDNTGKISSTLASNATDLPGLLAQANELSGSLNGHEAQLSSLVRRADSTMRALGADDGKPLEAAVKQLPDTLSTAQGSFDSLHKPLEDTRVALADLRPGVVDLGQATPDLRGVLTEGQTPLDRVPGVADRALPAITDLTGTMRDARPLVPATSRGLTDASNPVNSLAAYSSEVVQFFRRIESMVSAQVAPGVHGARVLPAVGGSLLTGGVLPHALEGTTPYPAPGAVDRFHTNSPLNVLPGGNF